MKITAAQFRLWMYTMIFLALASGILAGQAAAPVSPYQPDPEQTKDLKISQQAATIAGYQFQAAQVNYQTAMAALQAEGKKISDENVAKLHWPATVGYDINTGTFVDTKPPDAKGAAPEPKKP
jgi:hypothetical protein